MDNSSPLSSKQGWDSENNFPYTISVSPLDDGAINASSFNLDVKYEYLSSDQVPIFHSNPDISRWKILIAGEPYRGISQDIGVRLHEENVPFDIRNDFVSFIADHIWFQSNPSVGLYALIEIYVFDHEPLEMVIIKGGEREKECVICLKEFRLGFEAAKFPCSHIFHEGCILRWLNVKRGCPLCRHELPFVQETTTLEDIED